MNSDIDEISSDSPEVLAQQVYSEARKIRRDEQLKLWLSIISPFSLLFLWEFVSQVGLLDMRFFPPPTAILSTFWEMILSGELAENTWISVLRFLGGFMLGFLPAIVLGLIMGLYPLVKTLLDPIIGALLPIPKLALLPLIMLLFGIGEESKIVTIASGVFFFVLLDTVAGVVHIDKIYLEVAKSFGASRWIFFRTVAFPGALPFIFNGIKLGLGVGLLLIVAAEMIGAESGLGYLIWAGFKTFSLERMYVGLIMLAFLGYIFTILLSQLEKLVIPWKH
jgi:NitT/TauT family transport system permease protein